MIRFADWRRPADDAYAFALRATGTGGFDPAVPVSGARTDIRALAREALADGEADRFAARVTRWSGPEDRGADGGQPYLSAQHTFVERAAGDVLDRAALEEVLEGTVLVIRRAAGRVDFVLRDHHVLDVVLYHYRTTGELPSGLFHADRHSDWCRDSYLHARTPAQAATWWALLPGLKRPGGAAVLEEHDVIFTTAQPPPRDGDGSRDVGASTRVPGCVDRAALGWGDALSRAAERPPDWVSLDLDDFQPAAQLRLTRGLLRDPRFAGMMAAARVRLFVLSPQFTDGGDVVDPWVVRGSRSSSLRLLNWLRADRAG